MVICLDFMLVVVSWVVSLLLMGLKRVFVLEFMSMSLEFMCMRRM